MTTETRRIKVTTSHNYFTIRYDSTEEFNGLSVVSLIYSTRNQKQKYKEKKISYRVLIGTYLFFTLLLLLLL